MPSPAFTIGTDYTTTPTIDPVFTQLAPGQTSNLYAPSHTIPPPYYSTLHATVSPSTGFHATGLAPTPSLTASISTSPSGSDEPPERLARLSGGPTMWDHKPAKMPHTQVYHPNPLYLAGVDPLLTTPSLPVSTPMDPSFPALLTPASLLTPALGMPTPVMSNPDFKPALGSLTDPRLQYHLPTFEETDQPLTSSAATSTFDLPAEAVQAALESRRRSSAGSWAGAFTKMTLADGTFATAMIPPTLTDPFTASQVASALPQHATYPMPMHGPTGIPNAEGMRAGSSDPREMWTMLMTDPHSQMHLPMASPVAMGPGPSTTRRSVVGIPARPQPQRSLSKSTSMPDLKTPPTEEPTPQLQPDGTYVGFPVDEAASSEWRREIRLRNAAFAMTAAPSLRRAPINSPGYPGPEGSVRPLPAGIQRNMALQQTLAPERSPSFGSLTPIVTPTSNPGSYITPTNVKAGLMMPMPVQVPLVDFSRKTGIRPGAKRLASQTLGGVGKEARFEIWDGEEEEA